MFMIDPLFCSSMTRPAACANKKQPVRLTSMTCCHFSSGISSGIAPHDVPALFIKISTLPNSFTVASTTACTSSGFVTSHACPITLKSFARNCSTVSSIHSARLAHSIRLAPASASAVAISTPMPREPPVTIATRPVRSKRSFTCFGIGRWDIFTSYHESGRSTLSAQAFVACGTRLRLNISMAKTQKELAFLRDLYVNKEWTSRFTELIDKHVKFDNEENLLYINAGTGDHVFALRETLSDETAIFATAEDEHVLTIAREKAA